MEPAYKSEKWTSVPESRIVAKKVERACARGYASPMEKLKEKLVTHADHREAHRRQSPWLARIKLPTGLLMREGDRCEACRGRKMARHVDAEYRPAREAFFRVPVDDGARKFQTYKFPSPPELISAKLEAEPRECEVCGGFGVYTRAAVNEYFERHPERVCICQVNMDHPSTHHGYDASINSACPLFVTYVRTEEEQLREEVTERRTVEWRKSGVYSMFSGVQMMIDLEVASTMLQRSTDRLLDALQQSEELDKLAASIHADPNPFVLDLNPCRYDSEKLDRIVGGLRSRRVVIIRAKHGFSATGNAYFASVTRGLVFKEPEIDPRIQRHIWLAHAR